MATTTLEGLPGVTSILDEVNANAHSHPAYASFGDEGVTATANAHGHLLQITRYFENEQSHYCVDLQDTPPPDLIASRLGKFNDLYQNRNVGMRLKFEKLEGCENCESWIVNSQRPPMMKFMDDRWPLFITETPSFGLRIQYFISRKTIYQEYSFEIKEKHQVENIPNILIDADLHIRDLNFIKSNDENGHGDSEKESIYETRHNAGMIRRRVSQQMGNLENGTVGLTIMLFINGEHYNIEEKSHNCYRISPGEAARQHLQDHGKMVVTIAYTLELMDSAGSLGDVSEATHRSSQANNDFPRVKGMMDGNFEMLSFTEDNDLNFILRRNLEHILSVCSIPIKDSSETDIVPIALTCGDISNHRIMAGPSFYAFEFLLLALQHLKNDCTCDPKNKPCQDYKCRMRYRIRRTCHGHLIWLYKFALQNGLTSHHCVSGKVMKNGGSQLVEKSIMDLPFHIIKAANFCQIITDEDIRNEFVSEYKSIFERWILFLHLDNKNNEYVFPRSKDEKTHEFHLAEQAIIWRALKSGETFGIDSSKILNGKNKTIYSAVNVQNSILQKFSCKNSVSDKPMIAISRSVYGNTFKLDIQDTAIFRAVDLGLFTTSEDSGIGQYKTKLWMNTLDHQMESDGSIHTSWNDLSQAALAVITSAKSRCLELASVKCRRESAKFAILRSSSSNGLLTGRSSEDQEPIFPSDSSEYHSYWHAAFEFPYILWMYGINLPHADRPTSEHMSSREAALDTAFAELTLALESYASSSQSSDGEKQTTNYSKKKKYIEYPNKWLYTKPRYLTSDFDLRDEAAAKFYEKYKSRDSDIVIKKAFKVREKLTSSQSSKVFQNSRKGYIVDVPEFACSRKLEDFRPNYIHLAINLRLHIDPRVLSQFLEYEGTTLEKDLLPTPANKRLMHFHAMNFELAIACYQASSEAENLSQFFDRHATYDKYFYEDAQSIFNIWTTELHLSFYQITSSHLTIPDDIISELKQIRLPSFINDENSESISRVSMSLRFDGDIFDSSWICHFIEFNPEQIDKETTVQILTEIDINNTTPPNLWQERRILELSIFDKMLDEILQSSKKVLRQIKHSILENSKKRGKISTTDQQETAIDYDTAMLLVEFEILDKTPADIFLSIRSAWHQFQRITDIVEEDLKENITTIDLWMNREEKRQDKPQWLESSEQKYGWAISQLLAKNNRKFDELKRCYDSIKVFNASLTKRMEVASSKWEIQSSDDIRLFTYVTVVFLPISFATGIFSMSDSPSENILRHMVIVAAVALGATIIALFNAKALDSKLVRPIFKVCRYILKRFFDLLYYIVILPCVSLLYHIAILPCVYLAARYIYYPIFTREKSEEASTKAPVTSLQKPEDPPAKISVTKAEADTEPFSFAELWDNACKLFHKFDNPISLARENFEKAKSQREDTKKKASMA